MSAQKRALRALERARRAQRDSGYWRRIGEAIEQVLGESLPPLEAAAVVGLAAIDGERSFSERQGFGSASCGGEDSCFTCAHGVSLPGRRSILELPEAPWGDPM